MLENRMVKSTTEDDHRYVPYSESELKEQAHLAITDKDNFYHDVFLGLAESDGAPFLATFYELYQHTPLAKELLDMVKKGIQQ